MSVRLCIPTVIMSVSLCIPTIIMSVSLCIPTVIMSVRLCIPTVIMSVSLCIPTVIMSVRLCVPAAVPEPVHNCSVSDIGRSSAAVRCQSGWDGGLPQTFTLSVSQGGRSSATSTTNSSSKGAPRVLANTSSSPKAEFAVTGLEPGTQYVLTISAVNSRGHSASVSLAIDTHEDNAMKHISPGETSNIRISSITNVLYSIVFHYLIYSTCFLEYILLISYISYILCI